MPDVAIRYGAAAHAGPPIAAAPGSVVSLEGLLKDILV
jgi:hypothetical protein